MRILNHAILPLPLVLLLSVQLLGISSTSARLDEGDAELPSAQLLTRADTYLATGRGSDALELYDLVAGRDKSSYVSLSRPFIQFHAPRQRALIPSTLEMLDFSSICTSVVLHI